MGFRPDVGCWGLNGRPSRGCRPIGSYNVYNVAVFQRSRHDVGIVSHGFVPIRSKTTVYPAYACMNGNTVTAPPYIIPLLGIPIALTCIMGTWRGGRGGGGGEINSLKSNINIFFIHNDSSGSTRLGNTCMFI